MFWLPIEVRCRHARAIGRKILDKATPFADFPSSQSHEAE